VFVAGKETISIIEVVKNEDGETLFQFTSSAFKASED
jgi:hypothetical protein